MTVQEQLEIGMAHQRAGRLAEAETVCREILLKHPEDAQALNLLGMVQARNGAFETAMELFRRAMTIEPNVAKYRANLGAVFLRIGRLGEAIEVFRGALSISGDSVEAAMGLGNALRAAGRSEEAGAAYQLALAITRASPDASNALGIVFSKAGREEESLAAFRQAVENRPDHPEALANLSSVLSDRGLVAEAESTARSALQFRPDLGAAHNSLAKVLLRTHRTDEAIASYEEAARLLPESAIAWNNLAFALVNVGQIDRELECLSWAMQLDGSNPVFRSNWVNRIQYHPRFAAKDILAEARRWDEIFGGSGRSPAEVYKNDQTTERRLRIGYLSPDFREHVLARNVLALFRDRDRGRFEIFAYANISRPDEYSKRFESLSDGWRLIRGMADDVVAQMIRDDKIDILVDLAVHSSGNRLPVFARKPVPVQVTFAGYPGTTGLKAMDYRLTDPFLDPEGESDEFYSERSIRLPNSFWCYDPESMEVAEGFDVAPLPAMKNGFVTFGCLNSFCKVNEGVLEVWAKVLSAVTRSKILMLVPEGLSRQRVLKHFGKLGIDSGRIEFVGRLQRSEYMRTYNRIDVGLDTLPYNGHTTSLDSFWMGVPVVTLVGNTVAGRAGLSQLSNLGLPELIARTSEEFASIAASLAGDVRWLAQMRAGFRQRMRASPLTDADGFVRGVEDGYRRMWRTWCAEVAGAGV